MRSFYNLSIYVYILYIRLGSLFNIKARLMIAGRKDIFSSLSAKISSFRSPGSRLYWFHCASLGEFEQGRPLMEKLREQHPEIKILLTFFSPSGYEIRKNYSGADLVCYLPFDTVSNAEKFIELVKPDKVFFVKYEFWFNHLSELKKRMIPVYLVSGIFREDHHFFRSTGGWFRKQLGAFTHFFLQDERSLILLNSRGYTNTTLCGDTRFDRVAETARNAKEIMLVNSFTGSSKTLILGSSWSADEELIVSSGFPESGMKLIIAPHEIDESHLKGIEGKFPGALRFSSANASNVSEAKVLIIDNIGMLSSLYQYGSIAFIGGGFGKGIHNILEAATFGLPVIFGPNYRKFAEANELIKLGGAFAVKDKTELNTTMKLLSDEQVLKTASQISRMYVQGKVGATEKILSGI